MCNYIKTNKEKCKNDSKNYYCAFHYKYLISKKIKFDKEYFIEKNNEYYQKNKDKILEYNKIYSNKNLKNKRYYCKLCDTNTKNSSDYKKHLNTEKHQKKSQLNELELMINEDKNKYQKILLKPKNKDNYDKLKQKYKDNKNIIINPLTNRAVKKNTKTYKKLLKILDYKD